MSVSVRTSNTVIYPMTSKSKDGLKTYYSTEIMEPTTYNIEFSPDGGNNPKQMEQVFQKCADEGIDVDINYSLKQGRWGQIFVVYELKPVSPKKPIQAQG